MKLMAHQLKPISVPFPSQITHHVASVVDPQFMKATHQKYNRSFCKPGDHVSVLNPSLGDTWGHLISIDMENEYVIVGLPDGPELELPLSLLSGLRHQVGDVVRVLVDPLSDSRHIHHQNLDRSGIICETDPLLDDITIKYSPNSQVLVFHAEESCSHTLWYSFEFLGTFWNHIFQISQFMGLLVSSHHPLPRQRKTLFKLAML